MAKGNFGERLKRERELREVSQDELSKATRIGPRFLEALENEDWHKLPGGVFNRGYVRAIAKYLGLDAEKLLAEYDLAHGELNPPVPPPSGSQIPRPPIWIPIALALGALVVLSGLIVGGIYTWRHFAARRAARKAASVTNANTTATSTNNAITPDSAAALPLGVMVDLAVFRSRDTHVRVMRDGRMFVDEELAATETRRFSISRQFEVTAADSSAVLLELNGKAMPAIAPPGPPVQ